MINAPSETELLEEVDQWVSVHCQGLHFSGDSLEMAAVTADAVLAVVLETQTVPPAATPYFRPYNNELLNVESVWLNKARDRIQAEASLCREFAARRLSENAKLIYAARAAALEFAFKLLADTSNPMGYVDSPVPDNHVHAVERGTRSRRIETSNFAELPLEPQTGSGD